LGGSEDDLIKRIKECELVSDKLFTDEVWKIVIKDARLWVAQLDSVWQDVFDKEKLDQMRIIKMAYKHVADLPKKYSENLKSLKTKLEQSQEIRHDYES
jgi:hypothetical protein